MKITVIKKAATTRKPQNFCPWVVEEALLGQEVTEWRRTSARRLRAYKRRTTLWLWCGVVFLAVLPACSLVTTSSAQPPRNVLTIGFPEGRNHQRRNRVGQLITGFTLEGLTQVNRRRTRYAASG